MVMSLPLRVRVTELTTGGAAGTVTATGMRLAGVTSTPPAVSLIVSVMVPAVEPVEKLTAVIVAVGLTGIGMVWVVVLLVKSTAGSVTVFGGSGVKARVNVAVIGAGYGLTVKVTEAFCPASAVASALTVTVAGAATTVNTCDPATVTLSGSTTEIVNLPAMVNNDAGTTAVS